MRSVQLGSPNSVTAGPLRISQNPGCPWHLGGTWCPRYYVPSRSCGAAFMESVFCAACSKARGFKAAGSIRMRVSLALSPELCRRGGMYVCIYQILYAYKYVYTYIFIYLFKYTTYVSLFVRVIYIYTHVYMRKYVNYSIHI